jgi:hypothetical protein
MPETDASWLTEIGPCICSIARLPPTAVTLLRRQLGSAEIRIGIFAENEDAGIELQFADGNFRFLPMRIASFSCLAWRGSAQRSAISNGHRAAHGRN